MIVDLVFEHMVMVLAASVLTVLIGVSLGVWVFICSGPRSMILKSVEILQTIPAMAILGILMVIWGPGKPTVVLGLLLYSLLPVVQNTYTGLGTVNPAIRQAAQGMGMTRLYQLWHVELPIAFPMILAGIKIAAVTAVGVAVFAASVGGGGLGSIIYQGIRIQNMKLVISGTAALMLMALAIYLMLSLGEKLILHRPGVNNGKEG